MDDTGLPARPYRMPLSEVVKTQPYEPTNNRDMCPVLKEEHQVEGSFNLSDRDRPWRSGPNFLACFFSPLAPMSQSNKASPLGSRVVSGNFGWENFEVEDIPMPLGYNDWAADVLRNHSLHLRGNIPGRDYIYGAIFCSLGQFTASPSLVSIIRNVGCQYKHLPIFSWRAHHLSLRYVQDGWFAIGWGAL